MIRYLSSGLRGPDVKVVQDALNYRRRFLDKELVPDGAFGPKTRAAVVAFQKRYGLQPDGIVGPKTRQALFPLVTFTNYVAVSRFGEYPPSELGKTRSSNFVLASSKAKGVGGGDVPDPDPPLILPPLKLPTDPADGPMKTLDLSGFSLPAPALPETLFGLPQDSGQVQAGGQLTMRHLFQNKLGSPNPSAAAVLTFQQVYARNKNQDGHLEIALGAQVLAPFIAQTSDGFKWGIQPFVQFTWADILWRRGQFHLVSPFAQITAQTDFRLQDPVFGVGLFPVNISFDINDRLSIIGQLGVVGTYDLANKRIEAGAQPAIFGSWSF
jgi:peptidoglycan hydrolase-like protein with peptidoglycan-binding domain